MLHPDQAAGKPDLNVDTRLAVRRSGNWKYYAANVEMKLRKTLLEAEQAARLKSALALPPHKAGGVIEQSDNRKSLTAPFCPESLHQFSLEKVIKLLMPVRWYRTRGPVNFCDLILGPGGRS